MDDVLYLFQRLSNDSRNYIRSHHIKPLKQIVVEGGPVGKLRKLPLVSTKAYGNEEKFEWPPHLGVFSHLERRWLHNFKMHNFEIGRFNDAYLCVVAIKLNDFYDLSTFILGDKTERVYNTENIYASAMYKIPRRDHECNGCEKCNDCENIINAEYCQKRGCTGKPYTAGLLICSENKELLHCQCGGRGCRYPFCLHGPTCTCGKRGCAKDVREPEMQKISKVYI